MAHKLHLNDDGILYAKFIGNFELQDVEAYVKDFYAFFDTVPEEETLHILLDVSEVGKVSSAARRAMVNVLRDPDPRIGKSAMVGSSRYLRVLGGFLLKATRRDDVRFFEVQEEGLTWLQEESEG
jgi:hypothetical protein